MKTKTITLILVLSCHMIINAQEGILSVSSKTKPHVCSFNCSNTFEGIKSNCFFENPSKTVRQAKIDDSDINPYDEFDFIKYTLSQDPNNPFRLNYQFKECGETCNASAVEIDRIQYIFYNQDYINNLKSNENLKWIIRFIIGHEIGHHILGHTVPGVSKKPSVRRKDEIRADFFAGFVVKQFPGSSVDDALAALNSLDSNKYEPRNAIDENSSLYPLLSKRKQAVIEGFSDNDGLRIGMFENIRDIALASLKEYGRSSIYRTLDNLISKGNFLEANELIDEILNPQSNYEVFDEQELLEDRKKLEELKVDLENKIKIKEVQQIDQNDLDINEKDMNEIFKIYDKYKTNPSLLSKEQSEILKKSIKELRSIDLKEN